MKSLPAKLLLAALGPMAALSLALCLWTQGHLLPSPFARQFFAAPPATSFGLTPALAQYLGLSWGLLLLLLVSAVSLFWGLRRWVMRPLSHVATQLDRMTGQGKAQDWAALEAQLANLQQELIRQEQWANALCQGQAIPLGDAPSPRLPLGQSLMQLSQAWEERSRQVNSLALGDLKQDAALPETADALGQAVGRLSVNLRPLLQGLAEGATRLLQASEECAALGQELEQATGEIESQAKRVAGLGEGFFARVMQLSFSAQGIAANAAAMAEHAQGVDQALALAAQGTHDLEANIAQVAEQAATSHQRAEAALHLSLETGTSMQALSGAASQIKEINQMISEIAQQTKMLSLNAAIEASSAGAAGKGFAVVAAETKQLAQRTASATTEISQRIANMEAQTRTSVQGVQALGKTIAQVQQANGVISRSTQQQLAGAQGINQGMRTAANQGQALASRTQDLSKQVAEVATTAQGLVKGTQMISANLIEIHQACGDTHQGLRRLEAQGQLLQHLAQFWQGECQRFDHAQQAAPEVLVITVQDAPAAAAASPRRPRLHQPPLGMADLQAWYQQPLSPWDALGWEPASGLVILVGEHCA